ncbi:hypothetical protein TeGR_g10707 [Tetraparma gracilis]|uniref:16S rRNA (uracil(1498)-N(3))-methyltransferase n=1 Tax=Tetraparma gracilis TaxID=2962635 RepID=A0ABQ6MD72_9STRA|nr:hypothetical protein TeGR_g10707 [Tetraparma gracilis]
MPRSFRPLLPLLFSVMFATRVLSLNRLLFLPSEIRLLPSPSVTLPLSDPRVVHCRDILSVPLDGTPFAAPLKSGVVASFASSTPFIRPVNGTHVELPLDPKLIPQLASLGVGHLYLCAFEKTSKDYYGAHFLKAFSRNHDPSSPAASPYLEHAAMDALVLEGLSQAAGFRPPRITLLTRGRTKAFLRDGLDGRFPEGEFERAVLHPGGGRGLGELCAGGGGGGRLLAVGPEGGFEEEEVRELEGKGFERVGLGDDILRLDTAAVVAVGISNNVP